MNGKIIGSILIIISIILAVTLIFFNIQVNKNLEFELKLIPEGGSCVFHLEDNSTYCPHEQNANAKVPIYIGYGIAVVIFALGIFIIIFSKSEKQAQETQKTVEETQKKLMSTIEE